MCCWQNSLALANSARRPNVVAELSAFVLAPHLAFLALRFRNEPTIRAREKNRRRPREWRQRTLAQRAAGADCRDSRERPPQDPAHWLHPRRSRGARRCASRPNGSRFVVDCENISLKEVSLLLQLKECFRELGTPFVRRARPSHGVAAIRRPGGAHTCARCNRYSCS